MSETTTYQTCQEEDNTQSTYSIKQSKPIDTSKWLSYSVLILILIAMYAFLNYLFIPNLTDNPIVLASRPRSGSNDTNFSSNSGSISNSGKI